MFSGAVDSTDVSISFMDTALKALQVLPMQQENGLKTDPDMSGSPQITVSPGAEEKAPWDCSAHE